MITTELALGCREGQGKRSQVDNGGFVWITRKTIILLIEFGNTERRVCLSQLVNIESIKL